MTLTVVVLFSGKDNSQQFVKAVQPIFGQERLFLCPRDKFYSDFCGALVFAGVDKVAYRTDCAADAADYR